MPGRPRRDGTPAAPVNKRKLTDLFVSTRKPQQRAELIWDLKQPGLALSDSADRQEGVEGDLPLPRSATLAASRRRSLGRARRCAAARREDHARRHRGQGSGSRAQGGASDRHVRRSGCAVRRAARQEAQQVVAAGRGAGRAASAAALGQAQGLRHHPRRRSRHDDPHQCADRRKPDSRLGVGDLFVGDPSGDPRPSTHASWWTAIQPRIASACCPTPSLWRCGRSSTRH